MQRSEQMQSCPFCEIIRQDEFGYTERRYNKTLLSSPFFICIPALGPYSAGHVMVISRRHCTGLAALTADELADYELLLTRLRNHPLLRCSTEAEHGSFLDESSGACIVHTHVNVIPDVRGLASAIDRELTRLDVSTLADIKNVKAPYLFVRDEGATIAWDAPKVPSQYLRRVLWGLAGRDDWDWAAYPRFDLVDDTCALLADLLK